MILSRIILHALPEKQKELTQTLISMFETNGKDKGCISYDLLCNIRETAVFNLIEEWKTREDLNSYIKSERFSILLGTKSLLAKPIEIIIHSVFNTEGNDAVYTLRNKKS